MTVYVAGGEEGLPRGFRIMPCLSSNGTRKETLVDGRFFWSYQLERARLLEVGTGGWEVEFDFVESLTYPAPWLTGKAYEPVEADIIADLVKIAHSFVDAEALFKEDAAVDSMFPEDDGWTTVGS